MLRRVNAALFEAPIGARIQVVAAAQNNSGVNDARFEYAGQILPRETIVGLPGCAFTVQGSSARLQAVVVFANDALGSARYDLAEIENGVQSDLGKFTLKSDASPLIDFAIDPIAVAAAAAAAPRVARTAAKKTPRKAAKKTVARKKTATKKAATKKTAKKKAATKKAARKATRRGASRRR
jgi:hypothetical protein